MVKQATKYMLTHYERVDPKLIAEVTGDTERECWEYLSELDIAMRENQKAREAYLPKMYDELREWMNEMKDEARVVRTSVLKEKLMDAKKNYKTRNPKQVKRMVDEVKVLKGKKSHFTPMQIEQARNYPLDQLIESRRNMAHCPFHDDKTASMSIKGNFYYCFGCGETGDSIDYVMKKENLAFPEAITRLT